MAARKHAPSRRAVPIARPRRSERRAPAELPETISWWDAFYRVIRRIPAGRVTTYGVVAALAGYPRAARHVGYALAALKDTGEQRDVPWQRVVGAKARNRAAVTIKDPIGGAIQRGLLEAEGVEFDARGNIALDRFGWSGGGAKATKKVTKKVAGKAVKKTAKKTAKAGRAIKRR